MSYDRDQAWKTPNQKFKSGKTISYRKQALIMESIRKPYFLASLPKIILSEAVCLFPLQYIYFREEGTIIL